MHVKRMTIKCILVLLVGSSLLFWGCSSRDPKSTEETIGGRISISGAWALYPMVVKWSEEFSKLHPQVKIDVSAGGAGKGVADALSGVVDIGMVSRQIYPAEVDKGAWWIVVAKDAVVPVINKKNPLVGQLISRGLSPTTLEGIWITGSIETWGQAVGSDHTDRIHVYTRSDACGAGETWAGFLGGRQEDLIGVGVYGDPGLTEAVRKDILGIGYNNMGYAFESKTGKPIEGIMVLPIDLNSDGMIDDDENFYGDRDSLIKAVIRGKYPSPPSRELYFLCAGEPQSELVRMFIKWVLGEGQKFAPEAGYIGLSKDEVRIQLNRLEQSR
ncbi:MAG: PstS family phosphate ABC transporter substrate-binding protein [bacterium]